MNQAVLPVFVAPGSRVRIPDPDSRIGATMVTWTAKEARDVDGEIKIKCCGAGEVCAAKVKEVRK